MTQIKEGWNVKDKNSLYDRIKHSKNDEGVDTVKISEMTTTRGKSKRKKTCKDMDGHMT